MRRMPLFQLLTLATFCCAQALMAQMSSAEMSSTTKSSSKIEGFKPYVKPPSAGAPPKAELPPPVKRAPEVPQHAEYLHPGILVNLNGIWEGSDHLLNLSSNIGVYVKLIKPEEESLDIGEKDLQKQVESIFGDANIKPLTMAAVGKPPLPAFEIEIFVYPIERGYSAFLDGRLFESVVLERFKMDPNMAFQAITWEKQSLIVSPKDKFPEVLTKAVQEIAEAFVTRYQAFEQLKRTIH